MIPLPNGSHGITQDVDFLNVLLPGEGSPSGDHRPIPRRAHGDSSQLSFAQERMWLLDQIKSGGHTNTQFSIRIRGGLHVGALQHALNRIVQRHEILRVVFEVSGGEPRQSVRPAFAVPLPVVDLSGWPEEQRESAARAIATQEGAHIFDLHDGPLLHATLLQLSQEDHVLVLTIHPMVADGWSLSVFVNELLDFYSCVPVPELPIQYSDFTAWQRERFQGARFDRELRYWRNRLEGAPVFQELPTDRPRTVTTSHRGARQPLKLGRQLTERLRVLGQQEDCTLFMTLLAAFQTIVHRYTGSEDIVVGSPVANRTRPETEGLIGCFSNTLVLRTGLSGDPTFGELLGRVRKVARGAYAHQDFPFEKLVERLQTTPNPDFAPLFHLYFEFQNEAESVRHVAGLEVAPFDLDCLTSKFDLTLHLTECCGEIRGWVEYATDLFDARTIDRFIGHYTVLLQSITNGPHERISRLPMLPSNEQAWQLAAFDHTCKSISTRPLVHECIRYQAARTPSAVAVAYNGQSLTYRDLESRSSRLAHVLNSLDLEPDDIVAICIDRSLEMIIALLGVLKAGAAFLPLDPSFPEERLATILRDAQPRAILTLRNSTRNLQFCHQDEEESGTGGTPLIYLDAEAWEGVPYPRDPQIQQRIEPEHLAYVIYTSGSTGQPKGVQISHGAFANFVHSMQRRPGISAEDTLLAITTVSFDIAAMELLVPLTVGAKVVVASTTSACHGDELTRLFEEVQPTVMQATPATWRMLINAGWQGHDGLKVLCGGEAWSEELAAQLLCRCGSLWNMYGPTETTVWSAVEKVECGEPVLIGEPIANTSLYILDRHRQLVPIGVPGELYIGGSGLARGYLHRPELTERKFIPDPFRTEPGRRLYRTGDLARYKTNGRIEFLGRMDSQTKIRGLRVELGEVEAVLVSHPAVAHAVVTTYEAAPGEQCLAAYIMITLGFAPDTGALQQFLRRTLPEYMVPSRFAVVEALPMTSNGKIDRKALPALGERRLAAHEKPRNELEQTILRIWQDILGTRQIGLDDDFFDLGGHSLQVARMHQRLKEALGRDFPITSLFKNTTISRLSDFLEDTKADLTLSARQPVANAYHWSETSSVRKEREATV